MDVLAVSAAWIGVFGAAVGGLFAVLGTILGKRWDRALTIGERSREERKAVYVDFLVKAEECLYRFERVSKGTASEEDLNAFESFYDDQVKPQFEKLDLLGDPGVKEAAEKMKDQVKDFERNIKEHVLASGDSLQAIKKKFKQEKDEFIAVAKKDLEPPRPWWKRVRPWWKRVIARSSQ